MSQSYLDTLNKEQRVAAEHKDGPLLVLAGAGSGKTYTMTVRMKHLIEYHKIRPETILGITFTVKAAREMQERAEKLIGHQGRLINLSTFHSLCVKILRKDIYHLKESKASRKSDKGYDSSFTILDSKDQLQLVKESMKELEIDPKEHSPQAFLGWISSFKNELMSPAVVEKCMSLDGNPFATYFQFPPYLDMNKSISMARRVPKIYHGLVLNTYKRYMDKLVANNSCDFDDLIFLTARLLMEAPTVLGFYQEKFRYIMIDEYQDTNHAQYILAKLLAAKYRNIAVVGDDFQCIYGFRNADIRNILEFEKDYEGAKLVKLERNYRSTQQILERANRVIAHNTNQRKKTLWTDKTDGEEVIYHVCEDNYAEAEYVAQQIMMMRHKRDFKDFTILYRVNAQSRTFEEVFMKHGIPYDLVGAVNFYDRREIKDIIAYLRVLQNPDEEISLKRIINTPKRGIGQSSIDKMLAYAKENDISLWESLKLADFYLPKATAKKVAGFIDLMNNLKAEAENLPVGMLVDVIIEDSGYREDLKKQNNTDAEDRIQNLNEFLNVAWEYQQQEEESSIQGLLERITLNRAEESEKPEEEKDFVRLMTIHGSKGLEFPVVFGVGMEENILPYYKSIAEDNVEEERRLCYVLATRAKEQLYFLRARQRVVFNDIQMNEPSRFLKEMGFSEPESNNKNYVLPW